MTNPNGSEKAKRGRRGEGTIFWHEEKKCYRGDISLGYTPSGKRRRKTVYGPTIADVQDKFKKLRTELENGVEAAAKYTVKEAVRDWLTRGLIGRDAGTIEKNRILAETHVIPLLGAVKLRELTADHVDDWLADRRTVLATRSLKDTHAVLRRAIQHAQRRNKVLRNVAELVDIPEGRPGRPSKAMPLEQAQAVMEASKKTRLHAYFVLSLLTGVRTEEARALTWDRVHLEKEGDLPPYVEVWRSVRKGGDTKTKKSRRTLAIPEEVVNVLIAHQERQQVVRARGLTKNRWTENNLVFCDRYGKPLTAQSVRRTLAVALRIARLPVEWTPRELRHSFVSLMSANGASIELISRLVGHTTTATTETVYRHELRPVITEGAEIIGRAFGQTPPSEDR
ncbi:MAG: site-specific integrase [Carbonactinosporaceae bacterium]